MSATARLAIGSEFAALLSARIPEYLVSLRSLPLLIFVRVNRKDCSLGLLIESHAAIVRHDAAAVERHAIAVMEVAP